MTRSLGVLWRRMNRGYVAFSSLWLGVIGLTVYFSLWAFTTVDASRLKRSPGIVTSSSETASHVLEGDADRKVLLGGLERGQRVYLERWEGRIVSVAEPNSEQRLKTRLWPGRSDDRAFGPAFGWSILLGLVWLVWTAVLLVRRLRASYGLAAK